MKKTLILALCCFLSVGVSFNLMAAKYSQQTASQPDKKDLLGRWDLTVDVNGKPSPSWLEVKLSGNRTLIGSFVAIVGSARPVSEIQYDNGQFHFEIPPQWESGNQNLQVKGALQGLELRGTVVMSDGKEYSFKGVKAPALKRSADIEWGEAVDLFNGKDLAGWKATGENQWEVINGVLTSAQSGANLVSDQKFNDFKLHVEFRYKKGSNSGVYLRGRHEVQIEDSPKDAHPDSHLFSGVYGFLPPSEIAALGPDTWQTYDITLIGRMVTIVANGKTVISNQEIPGITGGALDSNEGEPGPIYIQGDHGPIEFRKITITEPK
ncbi:3-keto-disaccharide hydrolase [Albibacterium indicum]|uniref:3-keto-disaccharide hydrolase n=1 Tax=Albibacterium indicum TaxID=2292082 RepID=UPI000E4DB807|nr:DUF1080 domain-containing protein [Pedobacter indicus]